jgi:membrane-bound lytic murein transglycosylase D
VLLRFALITGTAMSVFPAASAPAGMSALPRSAGSAAAVSTQPGSPSPGSAPTLGSTASEATEPRSSEADQRLQRADTHFNSGRQMYFQGNLDGARREFDAAVDALLNAPESLPDRHRLERRLDEICELVYRFDVEKLGAGQNQENADFDKAPIDEISHMTFPVDENLAPKLKAELNQTPSAIPLELSDPVLSYVHYFSSEKGRRTLITGLQRSGRYRGLIQRVFAEQGVPLDLIYLAQAESGFLPRAVSRKQAVGMWQIIASTGSLYSLDRNHAYDDRLDPEKATRAAARFLKDLHNRYGDWYLAMAAYNCGAGAVDRAVERTGYADYWELLKRHALPKETAGYVPIIVAITIMAKNPKDYGLDDVAFDGPVEYDSVHLTAPTNLNLIADAAMQPVSVIKELNPSLLSNVAPASFELHLPKGSAETTMAALDAVPAGSRAAWRLHHVEAGDTLETIAKGYHLTAERVAAVNHAADSLEAGDVLLIPAVYHEAPRPRAGTASAKAKSGLGTNSVPKRTVSLHQPAHIAASRHVSPQVLHRKAAVRTAALAH